MAAGSTTVAKRRNAPSETEPLLGSSDGRDNGTLENQGDRAPTAGDDETPLAEEPSTLKLYVISLSMFSGVFLSALDTTIVATLSAPISTSFNSFKLLSWLATGYLISNAAIQPLSGKLTDIYGRRTGLILANIFFAGGTLICGLAKAEWVIILGRVVAGAGGGCINTISTFVCTDLVPTRRRGLWQGFGNLFFGIGSGLGGVFGGWISSIWGWRWAFLCQVPLIIISGIIVAITVKIPVKVTDKSRIKRVDFLGSITLVCTLVLLLLGLNSGGNIVPWNHPLVYVSFILSAVTFIAFVYVESYVAREPVIPVRLLLNRSVAACCLSNWFGAMTTYSLFYYIPIYFQARGFSATSAGAHLIPYSIGLSIGSLGVGFMIKWTGKYYWINVTVETLYVGACAIAVAFFRQDTPDELPFVTMLFTGIGGGGLLTATLIALISAVDHSDQAVITSASYAFRSTGSTIGITVCSAVFQNAVRSNLWKYLGGMDNAAEVIARLREDLEAIQRLSPEWRGPATMAYMDSLTLVWITTLVMISCGALAAFFVREYTLHTNLARK